MSSVPWLKNCYQVEVSEEIEKAIKAEVVKEFAKKLVEKVEYEEFMSGDEHIYLETVTVGDINRTLKEFGCYDEIY